MRSSSIIRIALSSLVAAVLSVSSVFQGLASAQSCPISFPPSPGNDLSAYITGYPYYSTSLGVNQPLVASLIVDVTNTIDGHNYPSPPIPYGLYSAFCMDQWDVINPVDITVPGTLFTGSLYSTCDPNLNSELPPGHPNTLVSPAIWQMVNYILNHHTYNNTNAFYWDIQTAINTLVGNGIGGPDGCGGILTTPTPSGLCGYPTNHPNVVTALLTAATNNAPDWTPQCGDVYGVVYVTPLLTPTNQMLLLEVPVCSGSIGVTKQVACLQPINDSGVFGPIATGYLGTNQPAFCYEITVTNSGAIPLTNITVSDNLLGVLSAQFTNFLAPSASSTAFFKMAFAADATNTVTVTGYAFLSQAETNGDTIIAPGTPFSASAQAIALVQPAAIGCTMTLSSPLDVSNGINPNAVYLPSATLYSTPPVVTFSVTVYNLSGTATLSNIVLTSDALTSLGCTLPAPFTLLPGKSAVFTAFCAEPVACPGLTLAVNATGQVMPGGSVCGVYDITSTSLIAVTTGCGGSISCVPPGTGGSCSGGTATLSGHVYVHCDNTTPVVSSDAPMAGVTVSLLNASSTVLATTATDVTGFYTFTGMAAGTYIVQVTPPANYVQTFPNGSSTSQMQFTVAACDNLVQDFGYSDQSPVTVSIPPGINLGCNPTTAVLPTDATVLATATAGDDRGPITAIVVSHTTTISPSGCIVTVVFTATATGTCGVMNSATATYTYLANTTPPVISGLPTTGFNLNCNPTSIYGDTDISNMVTVAGNCASATTFTVTHLDSTNNCAATRVFTIIATDACQNSVTQQLTYTWTVNTTPPTLTVPPGINYPCNPVSERGDSDVKALVTASGNCGSTTAVTVSHVDSVSGCVTTRTYTVTATDACNNSATGTVTDTWTVNTTPPTLTVPPGINYPCNPVSERGDSDVKALVTASGNCGSATTITVSHVDTVSGCVTTRKFTVTVTDSCNNSTTGYVTDTWMINTVPPTLVVPPGIPYGCNPTSERTDANVQALARATGNCGTATTITVSHVDTVNGCVTTRKFTVTATDSCNNTTTSFVTDTWTIDTTAPVIGSVPSGGSLGSNPATLPTDTSISNMVHVTDACGTSAYTVTHTDSSSVCTTTRTFTITAVDACNNHSTATVTYTWTDNGSLLITCPTNVTIATNFTPIYCTFTPSDWNSACNGSNTTATWWNTWASQNRGINCMGTWSNWWTSSTGNNPGANCWNFCQTPSGGNNNNNNNNWNNWCGGSWNQNSAPSWCGNWNTGNPNNNWWVPCNGFNPGSVLTNCFASVYTNGCVVVGLANGYHYKFTSCNAVRQCLGFTGSSGSLNCSATNPASCVAGTFCGQVLALQLNCDFGDAGACSGVSGRCGDLVYTDPTSPCNGETVREICQQANCVLGGGRAPTGCTASYLGTLCSNLNQCFEGCQVSSWCHSHLTPVYIPPPSVTGTATAIDACGNAVTVSYCDSVTNGRCASSYVITRTWTAVDTAGLSNYCEQTITIVPCTPVTSTVTCNPGQISGSSYLWCNARLSAAPNCDANLYCQNASITFNCGSGRTYTYPVPNGQICFSSHVTTATNYFNGTNWVSIVPCGGDSEIFLAGCGIAPNANLSHCQSVTWTGTFSCDKANVNCNWQFGCSGYNSNCTSYSNLGVKCCETVPCGNGAHYVSTDHAGTPENCKTSCTTSGNNNCYINNCGNSGSTTCSPNPCQ